MLKKCQHYLILFGPIDALDNGCFLLMRKNLAAIYRRAGDIHLEKKV